MITDQDVIFKSAGLLLSGTLTVPDANAPCPCVLMITGSGQVDRNESHKRLPINVMGELADHLAKRGIGSLRYDKRGVGRSEGGFWETGFYDNVADATAGLAFLKTHEKVRADKIFLLGHSEGAYIAARVAAADPEAAGAVLLAGGARLGEEELLWQGKQVAGSLSGINAWIVRLLRIDVVKSQKKQLDKIKRSRADWYRTQLVGKVNAKWMREFLAYDPAGDLGRIRVPILAITGSKDIQVDPGNLERMTSLVTAPFEHHVLPDVTHILRSEAGPGGLSTYKKQVRRELDPRVPALIVEWLERQSKELTR